MRARLRRVFGGTGFALAGLLLIAVLLALLFGRWLAIIQKPPTRQAVGERLLAHGRADEAAHLFEDQLWKGVALYRSGRYHRAVGAFVTDDSLTGLYNMGNAYAHLGLYEGAVAAYEAVLARMPGHEDARYNLDLVREAAARERELEEQARNTEEAGDWEDGLQQEPEEQGGEQDSSAKRDDDAPGSSEESGEETAGQEPAQSDDAPMSTESAGGSDQQSETAEAPNFTLTSDKEDENADLSPGEEDLENRPVAPGLIDRLREEDIADEIVLRRIEDDPALVLKARLTMALRKQEAGR